MLALDSRGKVSGSVTMSFVRPKHLPNLASTRFCPRTLFVSFMAGHMRRGPSQLTWGLRCGCLELIETVAESWCGDSASHGAEESPAPRTPPNL